MRYKNGVEPVPGRLISASTFVNLTFLGFGSSEFLLNFAP